MAVYRLSARFQSAAPLTANVVAVANSFGLGLDRTATFTVLDKLSVTIQPGWIVYVTGQSGSGKSTILKLLADKVKPHTDLNRIRLPRNKPLVDCFALPLQQTLHLLARVGLADAFLFLRTPQQLSDGQRYRLRLALALARKPETIFADEFASTLDRITAKVLAANVRKLAAERSTTFILATAHDDLYDDLQPHVYIEKHFGPRVSVRYAR